jgi:uncharacterized short protein YbdD (DUF466 family)
MQCADRLRAGLAHAWRMATHTARLAIGLPDYDAYCAHVRERHPGRTPMTREQFAIARMASRYARGASRCC